MVNSNKKGRSFERQVRDFFQGLFGSEQCRLHGPWESFDLTVGDVTVECKVRAREGGLATIYKWLDQANGGVVVAKLDRRKRIAITYLDDLVSICKKWGRLDRKDDEGG